jgi:gamma-glutamyltranspeptidase/glutathione hydrolase
VLVGVPGEIAGLHALHQIWGKKAFAYDIQPAIELAQNGFAISPHMGRAISHHAKALSRVSELKEELLPNGGPLKEGEVAKNLRLAATLREVAEHGSRAFYEGAIAKDLVSAARGFGSAISEKDFANYHVVERQPLHASYNGIELYTMPPPSAGGILFLQTLGMHSPESLRSLGLRSSAYVHLLAESFRASLSDRIRFIGDPIVVPDASQKLLDPKHLAATREQIKGDATTEIHAWPVREGGTSHLVVLDCEGNLVSLTTTVNDPFGARIVGSQTGVLLNDELDDFTSPSQLRQFKGLTESPNRPSALARPVSSMTPVIGLREQRPVVALGGSGGLRISQNVTQVFLGAVVFGEGARAVQSPRFSVDIGTSRLVGEAELLTDDFLKQVQGAGEKPTASSYPAAVQMVAFSPDGRGLLQAASDPRKFVFSLVATHDKR